MILDRPTIILGAGGHAKVVLDLVNAMGASVAGILDPQLNETGVTEWRGIPVLGDDSTLECYQTDRIYLANGLGSLPGWDRRNLLYDKLTVKGFYFPALVHPTVIMGSGVTISRGAQVMAGCILQADVSIGENTIVNTGAQLDHDCSIGKHCHIAPGATLSGDVSTGNCCHIGTNAAVIQGCHLGEGVVVGAGSTVLHDLPAYAKLLAAKPQALNITT
ncbi:MAG: acetyltransferase [Marinobacterium sp.]